MLQFFAYLKNTGKVVTKEELRVLVEQLPEGVILEVDILRKIKRRTKKNV
ncbi:MAG: hypothetical protein KH828_09860 [Clostridiales bacterium]|nr:hypothetical protein [Clostridiales bacterium]